MSRRLNIIRRYSMNASCLPTRSPVVPNRCSFLLARPACQVSEIPFCRTCDVLVGLRLEKALPKGHDDCRNCQLLLLISVVWRFHIAV